MSDAIQIYSEIGRLKQVLLHRPGEELLNLMPEHLDRLLFDDIPYLRLAREEHDQFAQLLSQQGGGGGLSGGPDRRGPDR